MQVRVVSAESTEDCRYPLEVMPDVGVDTGKARPRAAVAERRETNERPATVDVVRQRTTAVTLARVMVSVSVSSAQHPRLHSSLVVRATAVTVRHDRQLHLPGGQHSARRVL